MVDSVQIFEPGFRVLDASGNPVNGAKIKFREVGPGATRTVYSDKDLTVALGVIVYTRSDGYPVASQGSNTTVQVYTGNTPYNVEITDANDVAIYPAKDNVRGALDTSTFLTSGSASTLLIHGVTKTGNYTLVAGDNGKVINADATGGEFALTLTAAATLGDGWWCIVRNHSTNDNVARLVASQDISAPQLPAGIRSFPIRKGAGYVVTCNGGAFAISGCPPYLNGPLGIIQITDQVPSVPGSPLTGARYIATAIFSITNSAGSVVNTAVGDIIEADGAGRWIQLAPFTNCGWLAYVQSVNQLWQFKSTIWVRLFASNDFFTSLPARAYAEYTVNADLSTVIPFDDTIPQNTEGTEILSSSITLKTTSSRVRIRFDGFGVAATASATLALTAALFQDSIANALRAVTIDPNNTGAGGEGRPRFLALEFEHVPGVLNPTYKIRVGANTGNARMNGSGSARLLGGAAGSTLVVEELLT
jgi:hypothetical protein